MALPKTPKKCMLGKEGRVQPEDIRILQTDRTVDITLTYRSSEIEVPSLESVESQIAKETSLYDLSMT